MAADDEREGKDRTELERESQLENEDEGRDPHHALNNPVGQPDETEWPDPYEKRPDPRGEAPAPAPPSTSEPHPPTDREDLNPVKGNREGG